MIRRERGQSVAEYFLIFSVIIAAILACGFVDKVRGAFNTYFTRATTTMTEVVNP